MFESGGERPDVAGRHLAVAAGHDCVADLVGDARLRNEVDRLVALRVVRRHAAGRRPGEDHRHLALQPRRPLRDGVEIVVAGDRRLVLRRSSAASVVTPAGRRQLCLHVGVEELAAIGAELLQEAELVAGAAELAEMRRAIDIGRQLIGDELRDLRIIVPGRRHGERLAEFGLIGGLQLGIVEDVRAIVERELVAVVEHAPALALVQR